MAQLHRNPRILVEIEQDVVQAIEFKGDEVVRLARANASWSQTIPPNIRRGDAEMQGNDVVVPVGIKKDGFKLNFFEKGTAQRKTRSGAKRGSVRARPVMKPAIEAAKRTPLKLKGSQ